MKKVIVLCCLGVLTSNMYAMDTQDIMRAIRNLVRENSSQGWKKTDDGNLRKPTITVTIPDHDPVIYNPYTAEKALITLREIAQQQSSHCPTRSVLSSDVKSIVRNRSDVGINANPDWNLKKALVDPDRPNESWSKKQLQEFIEEKSDRLKIIHRDQPDEKTEVGINGNTVWNNELSSFNDYLLCAQRLYDALGFLTK